MDVEAVLRWCRPRHEHVEACQPVDGHILKLQFFQRRFSHVCRKAIERVVECALASRLHSRGILVEAVEERGLVLLRLLAVGVKFLHYEIPDVICRHRFYLLLTSEEDNLSINILLHLIDVSIQNLLVGMFFYLFLRRIPLIRKESCIKRNVARLVSVAYRYFENRWLTRF